jgi:hypothetical protein
VKTVLLLLILSLGLLLRIIGADWGFPLLLHPDEDTIAEVPADMAKRASLDPDVYMRPDHIEIYANAALYHAASMIKYGKPLTDTFESSKTFYYLLSRILVALLGAACITVAYLIGKEYGEGIGIIAALLFAVFPSYVGHSHYITSDIPLTLCILCSILFAVRYLKNPTNGKLMLLSLSSAFAVTVKYPGALTVLLTMTVILCTYYADKRKAFLELSKACLFFLFFAFIISPYLFINFQNVVQSFLFESRSAHYGAEGLGWLGNMLFYAESFLSFSGIVTLLFVLAGAFYVIRNEKIYSIPLFFGFLYWILLSTVPLHWERWALPMYTAPLLLAAYGSNSVYKVSVSSAKKYVVPICTFAFLIILFKLLIVSAVITAMFTLKDSRFSSYLFLKEMGINEENALYEGYTPLSPGTPHRVETNTGTIMDKKFIILSSYTYGRFLREKERYKSQNEFYNQIFSLELFKEFVPVSDEDFTDSSFWANENILRGVSFLITYLREKDNLLTGPRIRIYRLDLC